MRLCAGNEAHSYAARIIELVYSFDDDDMVIAEQIARDEFDVQEVLKNQHAMMGGIVSLSKVVTDMSDMMKRHFEASMTLTGGASGEKLDAGSTKTA